MRGKTDHRRRIPPNCSRNLESRTVFTIVSHVGGTRYESHDQFTGNQPLKDVIHAETVLPGSYRRGLDVRFEIRVDGWFRFYHFSLGLIVISCFLYKRVTFLRRPGDTKVLFFCHLTFSFDLRLNHFRRLFNRCHHLDNWSLVFSFGSLGLHNHFGLVVRY